MIEYIVTSASGEVIATLSDRYHEVSDVLYLTPAEAEQLDNLLDKD